MPAFFKIAFLNIQILSVILQFQIGSRIFSAKIPSFVSTV